MKIWFALLALCFPLIAGAVSATDSSISVQDGGQFNSFLYNLSLTPQKTDMSMSYLGYLFGNVDGVLEGNGSQVLATMFGVFNTAILSLGGLVLMYILIVSTLNTAHEGEFMGKKWSSIWIPLRSAAGVALLVPKASGYSFIQIFIMWIVVQGIGAGNSVWNAATTYLKLGGVLVVRPTVIKNMDVNRQQFNNIDLSKKLMSSLVCMYLVEDKINDAKKAAATLANNNGSYASPTNLLQTIKYNNPDLKDPTNLNIPGANKDNIPEGACGTISIPLVDPNQMKIANGSYEVAKGAIKGVRAATSGGISLATDLLDTNKTTPFSAAEIFSVANARGIATMQMINQLAPAARRIVTQVTAKTSDTNTDLATYAGSETLRQTAGTYAHLVEPAMNVNIGGSVDTTLSTEVREMRKDGWLSAGMYYHVLTKMKTSLIMGDPNKPKYINNSEPSQVNLDKLGLGTAAGWFFNSNTRYQSYLQKYGVFDVVIDDGARGIKSIPFVSLAARIVPSGLGPAGNGIINAIDDAFRPLFEFITKLFLPDDTIDPITRLSIMGTNLIQLTELIILIAITLVTGASAALGAIPFVALAPVAGVFSSWVGPIFLAIFLPVWGFAAVLAYYLPMVPFLLFTFTSLGWFFAVIEAMLAAPLIALGLVHPEGHEAFGKAEYSIMLIVNIFLKPSLIIFGFIAGIIVSYIGLWILNRGFGYVFVTGLFVPGRVMISPMVWIFAFVMLIALYTTTALTVVQKSFELIHILPNRIITWLGGQAAQYGMEQGMQEVKSGAQSAASGVGSAVKVGVKGVNQKMAEEKSNKESEAGTEIQSANKEPANPQKPPEKPQGT